MSEKLKPCPFCGGAAHPTAHLTYSWFAPVCASCGVKGPTVRIEHGIGQEEMRELLNKADELWNTRHTPDVQAEPVACRYKDAHGLWVIGHIVDKEKAAKYGCEFLYTAPPDVQTAVDAALESVADYYEELNKLYSTAHGNISISNEIRSRIGTNPLAERDARTAELEAQIVNQRAQLEGRHQYVGADYEFRLSERDARIAELEGIIQVMRDLDAKIEELQAKLAQAEARVAELERAIKPFADCYEPPAGYEHLGVTAHFDTEEVLAAKKACNVAGED